MYCINRSAERSQPDKAQDGVILELFQYQFFNTVLGFFKNSSQERIEQKGNTNAYQRKINERINHQSYYLNPSPLKNNIPRNKSNIDENKLTNNQKVDRNRIQTSYTKQVGSKNTSQDFPSQKSNSQCRNSNEEQDANQKKNETNNQLKNDIINFQSVKDQITLKLQEKTLPKEKQGQVAEKESTPKRSIVIQPKILVLPSQDKQYQNSPLKPQQEQNQAFNEIPQIQNSNKLQVDDKIQLKTDEQNKIKIKRLLQQEENEKKKLEDEQFQNIWEQFIQVDEINKEKYLEEQLNKKKLPRYYVSVIQKLLKTDHINPYLEGVKKQLEDIYQISKCIPKPLDQNFSRFPYRYFKYKEKKSDKIVVLELNQTLLSIMKKKPAKFEFILNYQKSNSKKKIECYINLRPYVNQFLIELEKYCEVFLYTIEDQSLTDNILKRYLEPNPKDSRIFTAVYTQELCFIVDGQFVKSIDVFGNCQENIIFIDSNIQTFKYHLSNGLPISPFTNDQSDAQLLDLLKYLKQFIFPASDVRVQINQLLKYDQFAMYPNYEEAIKKLFKP